MKESDEMESQPTPRCGWLCLGPLTFHDQIKGDKIHLSHGGLLAQKKVGSFRNGLLFSSRPIRLQERVRLRVVRRTSKWSGALRVGFTNVPPGGRHLPLPSLAIPDLTSTPGHWVAPVCESLCWPGSELEFWVSRGGNLYVSVRKHEHMLLSGLDLSRPLWALVDLYGQTQAVHLLGSRKRCLLFTRRSCPVPERIILPAVEDSNNLNYSLCSESIVGSKDSQGDESEQDCVVCMVEPSRVTLPCGHHCLCSQCLTKVWLLFGRCPLCQRDFKLLPSRANR
ncbi:E3 ubiquitin-protein ligase NEURL3-like [Synchiropus splendidus]|uniref:E3 ubiquitin-protein ligase NEURL3-like n=1 Tax=Synchiropus splendidus TaxID=270530 RepID=UPI00237E1865|nr:E3 ubiquitin-protein ligase NEURL3-like [Synchiropus splendidus]